MPATPLLPVPEGRMVTEYLTAKELARRLRLSTDTVRQMARDGKIPCLRISAKAIRFDPQAVAHALRQPRRKEVAGNAN